MVDEFIFVDDDSFEKTVLESTSPVVVVFWAPRSPPCRLATPMINKLAEEFKGHILMAKLNIDLNPQTTLQYHIISVPTLVIFKDGQEVDRIVGGAVWSVLKGKIEAIL